MAHAGQRIVQDMEDDTGYGMKVEEQDKGDTCSTCVEATQTKSSVTEKLATYEQGITVHSDICGPFDTRTKGGKRYFATFIVSKSLYCEVALLKMKDEVGEHLFNFIAWVERNTGRTVKRVHTDGAGEYKGMEKTHNARYKKQILALTCCKQCLSRYSDREGHIGRDWIPIQLHIS